MNTPLLGIESDKHRYEQAAALLASGKGGGMALWSSIEDATVDQPVSLLWFNPPYDRVRGAGRTEAALFNRIKDWPARGSGLLLREKMTCPTLETWGGELMKNICGSGMLLECESFGILAGLRAFVLSANAQEIFDGLISDHVATIGIPRRSAAA